MGRIKSLSWLSGATTIFLVSGYAVNILLGRVLRPADYGTYSVVISVITIINLFIASGVPLALAREIARKEGDAKQLLGLALVIQIVISLLSYVGLLMLASSIARLLHDPDLTNYLSLTGLTIFPYGLITLYINYFNGLKMFRRQSIVTAVYGISKLSLITLLGLRYGIFGALVGFGLSPLFALLVAFELPIRASIHKRWRRFLASSALLAVQSLLGYCQLTADLFLVKSLLSPEKAGYYAAAQTIAIVPYYISQVFVQHVYVHVASAHATKETKVLISLVRLHASLLLLFLVSYGSVVIFFAPFLMVKVFGPAYASGVSSLRVLAIGMSLIACYQYLASILNGFGKTSVVMLISLFGVCVSILAVWYFIQSWGLVGAAIGTSTSGVIILAIASYNIYHDWQVEFRDTAKGIDA